jgi:hypothetical protein
LVISEISSFVARFLPFSLAYDEKNYFEREKKAVIPPIKPDKINLRISATIIFSKFEYKS